MVEKSLARLKLEQSYFFKNCASEAISAQKRIAFFNFIEATIVFARSVTFYLQKEYSHKPDFKNWYSSKQEMMKKDPIFDFFVIKRNIVLKEGPVEVFRVVRFAGNGKIRFSSFAEINIIRGQPWYRRSPKIIWEDLRMVTIKPISRWLWQYKTKRKNIQIQKQSKTKVTKTEINGDDFFFNDPKWKSRPVFDLLHEYLNKLEQIIVEAEIKFSKDPS